MTQTIEMLLVDDDRSMVGSLGALIRASLSRRISMMGTSDPLVAKRWIETNRPDLVMTDLEMPELNGFEILKLAKSRNARCQVVICSGRFSIDILHLALNLGACDFVSKTGDPQDLLHTLDNACGRIVRWEHELDECDSSEQMALAPGV